MRGLPFWSRRGGLGNGPWTTSPAVRTWSVMPSIPLPDLYRLPYTAFGLPVRLNRSGFPTLWNDLYGVRSLEKEKGLCLDETATLNVPLWRTDTPEEGQPFCMWKNQTVAWTFPLYFAYWEEEEVVPSVPWRGVNDLLCNLPTPDSCSDTGIYPRPSHPCLPLEMVEKRRKRIPQDRGSTCACVPSLLPLTLPWHGMCGTSPVVSFHLACLPRFLHFQTIYSRV